MEGPFAYGGRPPPFGHARSSGKARPVCAPGTPSRNGYTARSRLTRTVRTPFFPAAGDNEPIALNTSHPHVFLFTAGIHACTRRALSPRCTPSSPAASSKDLLLPGVPRARTLHAFSQQVIKNILPAAPRPHTMCPRFRPTHSVMQKTFRHAKRRRPFGAFT